MRKTLIFLSAFILLIFGLFFTDLGRNYILKYTVKYFLQDKITISIAGADKTVENIKYINLKTVDGVEVKINNTKIKRTKLFAIPYLYIDKFQLVTCENNSKSIHKTNQDEQITQAKIINIVKMLPMFLAGVEIKNFNAVIENKNYNVENIKYIPKKQSISALTEYGKVSAQLHFNFPEISLDFNVLHQSGADIKGEINTSKKYKITCKYKNYNLFANGFFKNIKEIINVENCEINYDNYLLKTSGIIFPSKKEILLVLKTNEHLKLIQELSDDKIKDYAKNIQIKIHTCLYNDFLTNLSIQKEKKIISKSKIYYRNQKVISNSDIFIENNLLNLKAIIDKRILSANLKYNDKLITLLGNINDLTITNLNYISKNATINLIEPIVLKNLNDVSLNFDFDIKDKSAIGQGKLFYQGSINHFDINTVICNADFESIKYKNILFRKLKITGNINNAVILSDIVNLENINLYKSKLSKQNNVLCLNSKLNQKYDISVNGIISNDFKQIKLQKSDIKFQGKTISFYDSILDFNTNKYVLNIKSNKHEVPGVIKLIASQNVYQLHAENFHLNDLSEILNKSIKGVVDGEINLTNRNGIFVGKGNLSASKLLARNNKIDIDFDFSHKGVCLNTQVKTKGNPLNINIYMPLFLKNNFAFASNLNNLNIKIIGKNKIENFFELPDKSDLKGELDCNCNISGSLQNPNISGYINVSNMLISIGNVLLPNGSIELVGKGNNLIVKKAEFIDHEKHIAKATGHAKLFFEKYIPNLDTDLDLNFKNFFVLYSDPIKIQITGLGKMYGPINDMKLSGNLDVPFAEISNLSTKDSLENNKLEFLNDELLQKKKITSAENSFFYYDILMHCKKIKAVGSIFEIFLKGDLRLSMLKKRGTLIGDLNLYNGKVDLFGKRMKCRKGHVKFEKEHPYNPKVDILCQNNFNHMIVFLHVKSSPNKGSIFDLYSSPSYSQDTILSQMLFNKDMKSLKASEAAQLLHALSSLGRQGYLFSALNKFKSTGLWDNISFSTEDERYSSSLNKESSSSKQQFNISAGKYIRDNIYVSLNKKEEKTTFDIDLAISPTTSVKANTAGEFGISWKYRY